MTPRQQHELGDQPEVLDGLPEVRWQAKVSPSMDRREQLRLYSQAAGVDAAGRQVRLHRKELARRRQQKP